MSVIKDMMSEPIAHNDESEFSESFWHNCIMKKYNSDLSKYMGEKSYKQIYGELDNINDNSELLIKVSKWGYLPIVQYLVATVGTNIKTPYGYSAFTEAVNGGHLPVVQYLIEQGLTSPLIDRFILLDAMSYNHLDIVKCLLDNGANINEEYEYNTAICTVAVQNDNLPALQYLIERGANIHANCDEPIEFAAKSGNLPITKYLIENHIYTHQIMNKALKHASKRNHLLVVQYLIATAGGDA